MDDSLTRGEYVAVSLGVDQGGVRNGAQLAALGDVGRRMCTVRIDDAIDAATGDAKGTWKLGNQGSGVDERLRLARDFWVIMRNTYD